MATSCVCRIEGTKLHFESPIPFSISGSLVAPNIVIKFISLADLRLHCLVFPYEEKKNLWFGSR